VRDEIVERVLRWTKIHKEDSREKEKIVYSTRKYLLGFGVSGVTPASVW